MRIGLIGGTGFYRLADSETIHVETPDGEIPLYHARLGRHEVFFLPRHGTSHEHVPLQIPHRSHVHALRSAHCDYTIGINNVGSLRKDLRPGSWLVASDFLDQHRLQRATLHEDEPIHAHFDPPYCPTLQARLAKASGGIRGTYVGVDGPRFETPAEVRAFASMGGDVVGMTGVPEAVLMREAGLCYASLCFIANHATGLGPGVSPQQIQRRLASRRDDVLKILQQALRALPDVKPCRCARVASTLTSTRRTPS